MTAHKHCEPGLLNQLAGGDLSRAEAVKLLLHLQRCSRCYDAFRQQYPTQSEALWERLLGDLHPREPRPLASVAAYVRDRAAEVRAAKAAFGRLYSVPAEKRTLLITNTPAFKTLAGVQCLLEEAREHWHSSPEAALHWAELALAAADAIPAGKYPISLLADYTARAWAHCGNASRLCSELAAAESHFKRANFWLTLGTEEPLEKAFLSRLEASLARDRRDFVTAHGKYESALKQYREIGDSTHAAWMGVELAITSIVAGDFKPAIASLERILRHCSVQSEGIDVVISALHNLSLALLECGHLAEAAVRLREARQLGGAEADLLVETRFDWLEARILAGTDRTLEAESLFRQVQATFLLKAIPYDAALVSLDLAMLLLRRGSTKEVKELAEDMVAIFLERGIHREARAAGLLLVRALQDEEASVKLVQSVARYLKLARRDPTHRFTFAE